MVADQRVISAAAYLVKHHCEQVGKQWDQQGIHAAVRQAIEVDGRRVDQVVAAGFAAADDPAADTPAAIRWANRYPVTLGLVRDVTRAGPQCEVCGRPEVECRRADALVSPSLRHNIVAEARRETLEPATDPTERTRP